MKFSKKTTFYVYLLVSLILLLLPQHQEAQTKKKKRKRETTEISKSPTRKVKTIDDLTKHSKKIEGLFTIYQDTINGSIKLLVTKNQINKEFIHFSQIADGILDIGRTIRGAYQESKVIKVEKFFNSIEFVTQNTSFYFDPDSPLSKSKNANISNGVLLRLKILAQDEKKGMYLIAGDELLLKETFSQIKPLRNPSASSNVFKLGNLDKIKSKIRAIKNYTNNTNFEVEYVYSASAVLNNGSNAIADGRNISIKVFHNLIAMPENDYEIRFDDPRVGYFTKEVNDQTSTSSTPYRDLIHRWNLKKKNPEVAISEPIKPITWWIENSTPLEWRETIKNAALQWNVAFEKAGFKNAIEIKIQPDDATWDAGDINYNVLRWTSSPEPPFGGYGPSFTNPKTGEILGADIMLEFAYFTNRVFYDKLYEPTSNSINVEADKPLNSKHSLCFFSQNMHQEFLFANILSAFGENSKLHLERIKKEAMTLLIMHEIGHTLGLMHNMKASQLFSPEQLENPEFIKGKCLTASVMDYSPLNIAKDPEKQGHYNDVAIGPYDQWAIQFGYTPFKNQKECDTLLSQSTKPEHIFGNDADSMSHIGLGIDPRVMTGDQSNNAIKYAINRIEICDLILKKIKDKFLLDNTSYQELRRAYYVLSQQKANASNIISRYIGGVYVDRSLPGQEEQKTPFTPVSLEDQKRAMKALEDYVFAPDAFNAPKALYNYLAMQRRGFHFMKGPEDPKIHEQVLSYQKNVLKHLLHKNTLQRLTDSELYGNEYQLTDFMTHLNNAIFKVDRKGSVNTFRQNLQLEFTKMLIDILIGKQNENYPNYAKSIVMYQLKRIKNMPFSLGDISTRAHQTHLKTRIDNALKEVK